MKRLGPVKRTSRGFELVRFVDLNNVPCSIQASSLATSAAIWLGTDDAKPKILKEGLGWVPYPISDEVLLSTRMHLERGEVEALVNHLQSWLKRDTFKVQKPKATNA